MKQVGAYKGFLRGWMLETFGVDTRAILERSLPVLIAKITEELSDLGALKIAVFPYTKFVRPDSNKEVYLRADPRIILSTTDIEAEIRASFESSLEKQAVYTSEGSGWAVEDVMGVFLDVAQFSVLTGSSWKRLPAWIENKKAIVNVKNTDNKCFLWAMRASATVVKKNAERPNKYPSDLFNWDGITFPVSLEDIDIFEANNSPVSVYGCIDKTIVPLRIADSDDCVNLFYYENHYSYIKSPSRLFHSSSKHNGKKFRCNRCLHLFAKDETLQEHKPYCKGISKLATRTVMPEITELEFRDYQKQLPAPYVIYADFECMNKKLDFVEATTNKTGVHEVCGYGYVVVRYDGKTEEPKVYRGPDAAYKFLQCMKEEEKRIREKLKEEKPLRMKRDDNLLYWEANDCWICKKSLVERKRPVVNTWDSNTGKYLGEYHYQCHSSVRPYNKREEPYFSNRRCPRCTRLIVEEDVADKVRDHCHVTGKYRGAAHWKCNLLLRIDSLNMPIPIFFHNLRGYDSHILMQAVSRFDDKVNCIPNNMERYMSISLGKLRFLDSQQFLLSSLDKQVKLCTNFPISKKYEVPIGKGVFPYEYLDSWEKFQEPLPPIEAFYSSLNDSNISEKDYERAMKTYDGYECENLGDYHDLYLKSDVTQLADVFQNFRTMCMNYYGLDPANHYTSPGLSWNALLKMTGVKLDLFKDIDKYEFIERGIRGGVCGPSRRYCKANNPKVEYDPEKPKSYILYLDANNLYGWAMSQSLPTRNFKWASLDTNWDVSADSHTGYILEVDLEYPKELHDLHNDYPLAPEAMEVPAEWLSPQQKEQCPKYKSFRKLTMNLCDKENYVVHYRNLQFYLKHGLRLKKIHKIMQFTQEPWMESYISFNTEKRKQATNDAEKDLFKLMNNSVFGKTMENLRKRVDVRILKGDAVKKATASPGYVSHKVIHDLVLVHTKKAKLVLNKPVHVGFSVLELSKLLMYQFYYEVLKPKYGNKCRLLYTDTDSLLLEIETEDVYDDMLGDLDFYDTSDYPKEAALYSPKNKKVIGKMKDECKGEVISEYVGLRPKMYSILGFAKKAKGVKKYIVEKLITHELYLKVLKTKKPTYHSMNSIRSYGHTIHNVTSTKKSLSAFDSKRWICDDGINTLAFGHTAISNSSLTNPRLGPPNR